MSQHQFWRLRKVLEETGLGQVLRKQVASETVSHGICIAVRIRNSFLLVRHTAGP